MHNPNVSPPTESGGVHGCRDLKVLVALITTTPQDLDANSMINHNMMGVNRYWRSY